MLKTPATILLIVCLLAVTSCTTAYRLEQLDKDTKANLQEAQKRVLGKDAPLETIDIDGYRPWSLEKKNSRDALKLNLRQSLELGATYSRDYQSARETLYESALSLRAAQYLWEWNPTNNLKGLLGIAQKPSSTSFSSTSTLGFTKKLLSGGRLTGSMALTTFRYLSGDNTLSMNTLASLTLTQPLLAGAGELVARESLTQAERNLIYAMRTYIRTRENLLISITEDYYDVLNAEANLKIGQQRYESLKYSRERSEAMSEGGRVKQIDVDQAKQRQLNAESNLVTYRQSIESAKNALKLVLGLPIDTDIQLEARDMEVLTTMTLPRPEMTIQEAIQRALTQRLDFATVKDRLEDTERAIRIAENAMLMKADLSATAAAKGVQGNRLDLPRFKNASYDIGLTVDLPFDRMTETIALKRALIARNQRQRTIDDTRDSIIQTLQDTWNNLAAYDQKIKIQKISIALAKKRVENTRMLFEDGRIAIREYLDAQDDLSDAQNSIVQQLVTHRMTWLRLLYQLEELKVDPQTLWTTMLEVK